MLVPDLGGDAVAHIIDLRYNWSPVSVYAFIYGSFALPCALQIGSLFGRLPRGLHERLFNPAAFGLFAWVQIVL